jgi:NAD+ kinase
MKQNSVGIFVNRDKDKDFYFTKKVMKCVKKFGMIPLLAASEKKDERLPEMYDNEYVMENSDYVVSLGGDGTLLKTARSTFNYSIPVMGINLGTVGFLAEVEKNEIEKAIECLSKGSIHDKGIQRILCNKQYPPQKICLLF